MERALSQARLRSRPIRTAILTVSTSVSRREREDLSGPALAAAADAAGCEVLAIEVSFNGAEGGVTAEIRGHELRMRIERSQQR